MKIALGADHGGFAQKEFVKEALSKDYEIIDFGTYSTDSCDYVDFAEKVARSVASGESNYGVLFCTSGEGMIMSANKINGVRAGIAYNEDVVSAMRRHNDANVIAFGSKFMDNNDVVNRIKIFLTTDFEGGRHQRRVNKIIDLEK